MCLFVEVLWIGLTILPKLYPITHQVSSGNCEQSYFLILKEQNQNVLWIAETLDGECSHANLIQVDLEHDKPIARQTALRDFNSWVQLKQQLQNAIEYEEPIEILPENGVLLLRKRNARLVTPDRNQSLEKDYLRDFSAECARKWNDATREAGIDLPTVNGKLQLKLLYYSPDGLYFNYSIDKAYYFANSNLICIFTKNNFFKCNSQVTSMHGFMILEIK